MLEWNCSRTGQEVLHQGSACLSADEANCLEIASEGQHIDSAGLARRC